MGAACKDDRAVGGTLWSPNGPYYPGRSGVDACREQNSNQFWTKFPIFALFMKQMTFKCYFMASLPLKIVNYRSKLCIFAYLSHVRLSSDPHVRSVCPKNLCYRPNREIVTFLSHLLVKWRSRHWQLVGGTHPLRLFSFCILKFQKYSRPSEFHYIKISQFNISWL